MLHICDTHVLIFWASQPEELSATAALSIENGLKTQSLACASISLWEIAMLVNKGRLQLPAQISADRYIQAILDAMDLSVLPITAEIAALSQHATFSHGDPADRLIAATAIATQSALISADQQLHTVQQLHCIW